MTERITNQPDTPSGLKAQIEDLIQVARPIVDEIRVQLSRFAPLIVTIAEGLKTFPDRTKMALLKLGSHGWYLDPELPAGAIFQLAEIFDTTTKEEADRVLCSWVDAHANDIETRLANSYPKRREILRQAFAAHNQKLYAVSTPVFLAQADGICQELHDGVQLFKRLRGSGELALKKKAQSLYIGDFEMAMLAPLLEPMPIVANAHERILSSNQLNRHAILHGESLDYGTFENGCRAISLLTYSAWALQELMPNRSLKPTDSPPARPKLS